MLRITMGLASLLLALPATGQDSSADYTRDYQRQALAIYRHVAAVAGSGFQRHERLRGEPG
jgi:hypothetical protein